MILLLTNINEKKILNHKDVIKIKLLKIFKIQTKKTINPNMKIMTI